MTLAHSKAFYRAQKKLTERQRRRKEREAQGGAAMPAPPFGSPSACEAYLVERLRGGKHRCRRCGSARGCYLSSRRCWECGDCRAQAGLRTGTVMARSPVRLWQWFEAIRWILWRPTIDTSELAEKLGIRRPTTVRAMAKKIRAALAAEDGSQQLAGLDVHYGRRDAAT